MHFGLLLPHFGVHASRERLIGGSVRAEELGFESLFVRDHIVYEPHGGIEDDDPAFYDALTTLTVVGAHTSSITLGTGALVPFRHPLHLARILGTMTELVGERLLLGLGAGRFDREFESVGLGGHERLQLLKENVAILRALVADGRASHESAAYAFTDVEISPVPGSLPIWYCGGTPASARIAVDEQLGWLPGRITLATIRARREVMRERSATAGLPMPQIGVIVPARVEATRAEALEKVNVDGLLDWANDFGKWWVKPVSGRFETVDDLQGSLLAGNPDDIATEVEAFRGAGVDHLVFDLRTQFDRWEELVELLGAEVVTQFRG